MSLLSFVCFFFFDRLANLISFFFIKTTFFVAATSSMKLTSEPVFDFSSNCVDMNRGFDMTPPDMGYPSDTRGSFGGGPIRGFDAHRGSHQPSPGGDGGTQVFVGNLSSEVTWEDLKDSFKKVGPVFFCRY